MKHTRASGLALLLVLLLLPTTAAAADRPCQEEIGKFCSDIQARNDRRRARLIAECLFVHRAELSDECKSRGREIGLRLAEGARDVIEPCRDDYARFCSDLPRDGNWARRTGECLASHEKELSADCRQQRERVRETTDRAAQLTRAIAEPCRDDYNQLCSDVPQDRDWARNVAACFSSHEAELTRDCRRQRARVQKMAEEFREPCEADVEEFCSDVAAGPRRASRILSCLRDHEAELSDQCRDQRQAIHEGVDVFFRSCRKEVRQFCEGKVFLRACLQQHEEELSEDCAAKVSSE